MAQTVQNTVPAPDLGIPLSPHTVDVSIINTNSTVQGVSAHLFFTPPLQGYDWLGVPVFSFLIQHPGLNRSLIFDLGIRKDWENLSSPVLSRIKGGGWTLRVEKDVHEILEEGGVNPNSIKAIVWSHHHFDHTGDPSKFPPSTSLIVGPGFTKAMLPGYPINQNSPILESDLANRALIELDFSPEDNNSGPFRAHTIGRFQALDYFGDGSFYLLGTPGHTTSHIGALAHPDSFILLAGDAIHHVGEIRPSQYLPLPDQPCPESNPHPLDSHYPCPCGEVFEDAIFRGRGRAKDQPIWDPVGLKEGEESLHDGAHEVMHTAEKLQAWDAQDHVLLAAAHDESLLFDERVCGACLWVRQRWRFLRDFARPVGKEDHEVVRRRDWGPPGHENAGEKGEKA
ncbi:beta-lactamase-like protein [Chaetomium strumarium]|uniref:Beta-lactamase-like protein n=1 Tax=Chaetomium strumarium TaxID=1170767 RepID=A0AAJ0GPS2_9PEZI|nr:beta-lactamase-like protein [Chaetomium strumarium]